MPLLPLVNKDQHQETDIANWHCFSSQISKRNSFTDLKEKAMETCKRAGVVDQLPTVPLTTVFTEISNNAQGFALLSPCTTIPCITGISLSLSRLFQPLLHA